MSGKGKKIAKQAAGLLLVSSMVLGALTGCGISLRAEVKTNIPAQETKESDKTNTTVSEQKSDAFATVSGYDMVIKTDRQGFSYSDFYFYFTNDNEQSYYVEVSEGSKGHLVLRSLIGKKVDLGQVNREFAAVREISVPEGLVVEEKSPQKVSVQQENSPLLQQYQKTR